MGDLFGSYKAAKDYNQKFYNQQFEKADIIIFFLIFNALFSHAQSIEETLLIADSAYAKEEYSTAASLYERVLFFDKSLKLSANVYDKLANAHYNTKSYADAYYYYEFGH